MTTFIENNKVVQVATPGAWAASAQYGIWNSILGFNRITFILSNGELDADMPFKVYAASDDAGADAAEVSTSLRNTFTNGTHEGKVGLIEVLNSDLPADLPYVTIQATPGAADNLSCVAVLSEPTVAPVDISHLAFADSLA